LLRAVAVAEVVGLAKQDLLHLENLDFFLELLVAVAVAVRVTV
jgi:hypothetical protein